MDYVEIVINSFKETEQSNDLKLKKKSVSPSFSLLLCDFALLTFVSLDVPPIFRS